MNLWSAILLGLKEIWAHKFRSMLTMLGIILGVSSLIAMSALVKGMEVGMKEALIAIGGLEKFRIEPREVPIEQRHLRDQAPGVTLNDVHALEYNSTLITSLSPEMRLFNGIVTANGKSFRPWNAIGVWPIALEMYEHEIAHGRMFNEIDDESARSVCVIGTAVRDELFGSPEKVGREIVPVGETIYINRIPFTVIGMFKHYESDQERKMREFAAAQATNSQTGPVRSRGWSGRGAGSFVFRLKNNTILMPLNTMWIKIRSGATAGMPGERGGGPPGATAYAGDPRLSSLEVKVRDFDSLNPALQQVHNILMSTHKGIEDFTFRTQEDWAENITLFIRNARLSGGLIAAISLLVGGIGIMNIMLASISERVREIGIRKSVGATTEDVFIQILVESVVLAILGGIAGLATSFMLVHGLASLSPTDNTPVITPTAMLFAFSASVLIGILAGLIPAFKASRLHPIQALRYE
jgi:putative ABC transport system permease protein